MTDLTKHSPQRKVSEAAALYFTDRQDEVAMTTISTKNQITLPAHLLRELGLTAGDRLAITREGGRLVLRARPRDWVSYHAGSLVGVYGATREEIDAGIRDLRDDPDRDEAIEGAWAGHKPDPQR
ncbi:MAG: AbrB/MazE/SpoVT family DNA-binding domain-containing protein [Dehalococcoidia bacterium]|nr:AbrB/MazE/SpoVT family DNA-binding domain-containing protein [Dehalococcoidia bacterium]